MVDEVEREEERAGEWWAESMTLMSGVRPSGTRMARSEGQRRESQEMQCAPRNAVPGLNANRGRANGRPLSKIAEVGRKEVETEAVLERFKRLHGLANQDLLVGHRPME